MVGQAGCTDAICSAGSSTNTTDELHERICAPYELRGLSQFPNPTGNRQAFVLQQHAEVNLLAAIYRGLPPAPNLAQQLQSLRDSYRNGGDFRGVANTTAALALAAFAAGDRRQAEQLLLDAEQASADARPRQLPDPSGIALVARRRRLFQRLTDAPTRPSRRAHP
jgi:hypothetical protein